MLFVLTRIDLPGVSLLLEALKGFNQLVRIPAGALGDVTHPLFGF